MDETAVKAFLESAAFGDSGVEPQPTPPDFEALEAEIAEQYPADPQLRFPAAMRALYQWSFKEAQMGPVRLIDAPSGRPLQQLRERIFDYYDPEAIAGQGLLVIADDANDGGPLCLKAERDAPPEEWAVWLWDHEHRAATDRLFSSAGKMVEVLVAIEGGSTVAQAAELDPGTDLAASYSWWDEE